MNERVAPVSRPPCPFCGSNEWPEPPSSEVTDEQIVVLADNLSTEVNFGGDLWGFSRESLMEFARSLLKTRS